ncbi:hypothetical protein FQA39_LY00701 [Lamprigera yunnana]|nr:hypothetical protein FQA39_LY00701 [Lamprigera yunnana]
MQTLQNNKTLKVKRNDTTEKVNSNAKTSRDAKQKCTNGVVCLNKSSTQQPQNSAKEWRSVDFSNESYKEQENKSTNGYCLKSNNNQLQQNILQLMQKLMGNGPPKSKELQEETNSISRGNDGKDYDTKCIKTYSEDAYQKLQLLYLIKNFQEGRSTNVNQKLTNDELSTNTIKEKSEIQKSNIEKYSQVIKCGESKPAAETSDHTQGSVEQSANKSSDTEYSNQQENNVVKNKNKLKQNGNCELTIQTFKNTMLLQKILRLMQKLVSNSTDNSENEKRKSCRHYERKESNVFVENVNRGFQENAQQNFHQECVGANTGNVLTSNTNPVPFPHFSNQLCNEQENSATKNEKYTECEYITSNSKFVQQPKEECETGERYTNGKKEVTKLTTNVIKTFDLKECADDYKKDPVNVSNADTDVKVTKTIYEDDEHKRKKRRKLIQSNRIRAQREVDVGQIKEIGYPLKALMHHVHHLIRCNFTWGLENSFGSTEFAFIIIRDLIVNVKKYEKCSSFSLGSEYTIFNSDPTIDSYTVSGFSNKYSKNYTKERIIKDVGKTSGPKMTSSKILRLLEKGDQVLDKLERKTDLLMRKLEPVEISNSGVRPAESDIVLDSNSCNAGPPTGPELPDGKQAAWAEAPGALVEQYLNSTLIKSKGSDDIAYLKECTSEDDLMWYLPRSMWLNPDKLLPEFSVNKKQYTSANICDKCKGFIRNSSETAKSKIQKDVKLSNKHENVISNIPGSSSNNNYQL